MAKYHINGKGAATLCRAKDKCPFGGETGVENHFATKEAAEASYEKTMGAAPAQSISKASSKSDKASKAKAGARAAKYANESEEFHQADAEFKAIRSEIEKSKRVLGAIVKRTPKFKTTKKWFTMVQAEKELLYKRLEIERRRDALMSEEAKAANEAQYASKPRTPNPNFNFHPEIEGGKAEQSAFNALVAFSGEDPKALAEKIQGKQEAGKTKTEAYREAWAEAPLRTDKPLVAIDLECASPMLNGRVDTGPYSNIIEVGYLKRYPDGRVERKQYLCGVPENFAKLEGTGAEHIHHISPEMVKDESVFVEDVARQKELLEDLRGSLLIAHNANYEVNQFTHNLYGFNRAMSEGEIEVLDTRDVCKWYVPEAANNSNEAFVKAAGGEYEGAHRALEDAEMSFNALFKLKGVQ